MNKLKLTGNRCQCQDCEQYFESTSAFGEHRTGEHGISRRCLSEAEMVGKGMVLGKNGFWLGEARSQKTLTGDRNQCQGCKLYFNSVSAFDKHRTGEHGVSRRCLSEAEMVGKGMVLGKNGFWLGKAMSQGRIAKMEASSGPVEASN